MLCEVFNEKHIQYKNHQKTLDDLKANDVPLTGYLKAKDEAGILFEDKTIYILQDMSQVQKKDIFSMKERCYYTLKNTN